MPRSPHDKTIVVEIPLENGWSITRRDGQWVAGPPTGGTPIVVTWFDTPIMLVGKPSVESY